MLFLGLEKATGKLNTKSLGVVLLGMKNESFFVVAAICILKIVYKIFS